MTRQASLGEFEQLVLLAALRLGEDAYANGISAELETRAARRVTRGALYSTLDRLEAKGYLTWSVEAATPDRGGHPARRFRVTAQGLSALRQHQAAYTRLSAGIEELLAGPEAP